MFLLCISQLVFSEFSNHSFIRPWLGPLIDLCAFENVWLNPYLVRNLKTTNVPPFEALSHKDIHRLTRCLTKRWVISELLKEHDVARLIVRTKNCSSFINTDATNATQKNRVAAWLVEASHPCHVDGLQSQLFFWTVHGTTNRAPNVVALI